MLSIPTPFLSLLLIVFSAALPAQEEAVDPGSAPEKGARVSFRYDLADAAVGGDGRRPFLSAPGRIVPAISPGVFLRVPAVACVNAVFAPSAVGETNISTKGLRFDFSATVGKGGTGAPPARGPFGSIGDPSGTMGLPDYRGGAGSLLEMPANCGISFDLDVIRAGLGLGARLERFRGVAGSPDGRDTGWCVLVDGELVASGTLEGRAWAPVVAELPARARLLTLVTTDAGAKGAGAPAAFFGDPVIEGSGTPAQGAPAPIEPWPSSTDFRPWMPVRVGPGLGIARYELFIWPEEEEEPAAPIATSPRALIWPDAPLAAETIHKLRLRCTMEDGTVHRGAVHRFRTAAAAGKGVPPFDISPSARRDRTEIYDVAGLDGLVAAIELHGKPLTIAFWGDSITDVSRWQRPLVDRLRREETTRELGLRFLNRGVNGAKIDDLLVGRRRWPRGAGPAEVKPAATQLAEDKADIVVLFIGANEVNYYRAGDYVGKKVERDSPPTTDAEFEEGLVAFLEAATRAGSKVVLGTPFLRGERPDGSNPHDGRLDRFADACARVAESKRARFVPLRDAARAWLMNHNWRLGPAGDFRSGADRGGLTTDGVHPNAAGRVLIADLFAAGIARALDG